MRRLVAVMCGRGMALLCLALLLLVGPAGAQDAATLGKAEAALEAARSMRAVRALAAPELDAAEKALERVLAARDAGKSRDELEHLAYLAERRAAIARMRARERQIARALEALSVTQALIAKARALEAAAAGRRALVLAQRLTRFEVQADPQGLLLTPRERWFEVDLAPTPGVQRAIAEAARLVGELPGREIVVLGYAVHTGPHVARRDGGAATDAAIVQAIRRPDGAAGAETGGEPDDLGCVRADVVRAFLISRGVDPRRIAANCLASPAQQALRSAGQIAIAILPEDGPARQPASRPTIDSRSAAPRLSAGASPDEPPTTR